MKKTVLVLVLAVVSSGVCAMWVALTETSEAINYLDPATIRRDGNLRRVWQLSDLKERDKDGAMSLRNLWEYDCKEDRFRLLSGSVHSEPNAGGKVLSSQSQRGDWNYIPPGSASSATLKYVCAR